MAHELGHIILHWGWPTFNQPKNIVFYTEMNMTILILS